MNITAITRYKSGTIYTLLKKLGWTQVELSRRTKIRQQNIGQIINLFKRPTPEQANAIQMAFGEAGEYIDILSEWPETFQGLKTNKVEQTADIDTETLLDNPEILQIEAPPVEHYDDKLTAALEDAMSTLTDREREVITQKHIHNKTLSEIGREFRRDRQSIANIETRAFRELRKASRLKKLLEFVPDKAKTIPAVLCD